MPIYQGKRPDGSVFEIEWVPLSEDVATIKGKSANFCRPCLETNYGGIGILIDGICSNGCQESTSRMKTRVKKVPSKIEQRLNNLEKEKEKENKLKDYTSDPRAIKYFPDVDSRSHLMFSELAAAGAAGCLQSVLIAKVVELCSATKTSVRTDVSAKSTRWRSLENNPCPDEWWLFTSLEPKAGRPRKDSEGQRLWIVFKGDSIPDKAFIDPNATFPQWVHDQLV